MLKEFKLSELGKIVGGATPSTKIPEFFKGDIPWITPKDLADFPKRYISSGERSISKEALNSCSAQMLPKNSILFSSRAPIGYIAIAQNDLCTNQGFKSIVPNTNIVDPLFLFYLLKSSVNNIVKQASGTTFKEISGKTLGQIKVLMPESITEQQQIASLLGTIDDAIELNQAINDNLTALISTMYDSCITKSISHGTAQKLTFNCFANITSGKRPNSFSKTESSVFSIPVYGASSLLGFCDSWIYNEPILIIGRVGSLGVVTRSKKFSWPSDNTLVISTQFYEFTCETLRRIDYKKISGGSSQPLITQKNLCQYPVIVPSEHELLDFEEKSYPYMDLYDENNEQNEYLRKIRDYLANNLFSANIELRK